MRLSPGALMNVNFVFPSSIAAFALDLLAIRVGAGHQAGAEDRQAAGEDGARDRRNRRPRRAAAPPPAPPSDVRYKTTYTDGDQVTESTTFIRDNRERYELGDTILIKQRDQKRTVQISRAANTYLITAGRRDAAAPRRRRRRRSRPAS